MKTRNYNEEQVSRRLIIAMLEADRPMTIEELASATKLETDQENDFRHTLMQNRYKGWIEDAGLVWQLTEDGHEYATWCKAYPQRARRMRSERRPRAIQPNRRAS